MCVRNGKNENTLQIQFPVHKKKLTEQSQHIPTKM